MDDQDLSTPARRCVVSAPAGRGVVSAPAGREGVVSTPAGRGVVSTPAGRGVALYSSRERCAASQATQQILPPCSGTHSSLKQEEQEEMK